MMKIRSFAWQEGYGAVTVSPSDVPTVRRYIARQEEHHRKKTFPEEYREILVESGIPFDERYLW
jgi:putative transposase